MPNAAVAESASPGPEANAQHVFFRLLSSTLSAKKRSRTDRNLALNRNQFCIQRNDVRKIDVAAKQVHVALGGGDTGRSVEMWERPESLRMFLKWTVLCHCHFVTGLTLPQSSQDALGSLLKSHALNNSLRVEPQNEPAELRSGLLHLQELDIAECNFQDEAVALWSLTDGGKARIQEGVILVSPVLASQSRQNIPLASQTSLELLHHLKQLGWTLCIEANRSVEPPPFSIVDGRPSNRQIYARPSQKTVLQPYLLCLASLGNDRAGALQVMSSEVRHFQVKAYYLELLGMDVKVEGSRSKNADASRCGS